MQVRGPFFPASARAAFSKIASFGFSETLVRLTPFVTVLYLSKVMTLEEFGYASVVMVVYELMFIFISNNIPATTRELYFNKEKGELTISTVNSFAICSAISIFVFVVLMMGYALSLIPLFFLFLVPAALMRVVGTWAQAMFQCQGQARRYMAVSTTFSVCTLALIFLVVSRYPSVWGWAYAQVGSATIFCLLSLGLIRPQKPLHEAFSSIQKSVLVARFNHGISYHPQALSWWLKASFDRVLIFHFFGAASVGVFALAQQLSSSITIAGNVLNLAFYPSIGKYFKAGDSVKIRRMIAGLAIVLVVLAVCAAAAISMVVSYFFDAEYALASEYAYGLVAVALLQSIILVLVNPLYLHGKSKFVAAAVSATFLLQASISAGAAYLGIGIWGLIGLSIAGSATLLMIVRSRFNRLLGSADNAT